MELLGSALPGQNTTQLPGSVGGVAVDIGCTVGLNNVLLQGTVSSILPGASAVALGLAAAPGGNLRLVGASGAELFELVSRQLVIGIAVG